MRLPQSRRGFTLIEIVVSMTLLLVLSGLLIANYNEFNNSQIVKQATSIVRSNIQAARTKATSGFKPDGCDQLVGYQVDFPTTTTYTISATCIVSGVQQLTGEMTTYSLPAGVSFPVSLPQSTIFYALARGASATQIITLSGYNKTAVLTILTSGAVN